MTDIRVEQLLRLIASTADVDEPITPDTPLISSGLIDSFDLVGLVAELEDAYQVEIPVEEISVETFDTPRLMLQWLERGGP